MVIHLAIDKRALFMLESLQFGEIEARSLRVHLRLAAAQWGFVSINRPRKQYSLDSESQSHNCL